MTFTLLTPFLYWLFRLLVLLIRYILSPGLSFGKQNADVIWLPRYPSHSSVFFFCLKQCVSQGLFCCHDDYLTFCWWLNTMNLFILNPPCCFIPYKNLHQVRKRTYVSCPSFIAETLKDRCVRFFHYEDNVWHSVAIISTCIVCKMYINLPQGSNTDAPKGSALHGIVHCNGDTDTALYIIFT